MGFDPRQAIVRAGVQPAVDLRPTAWQQRRFLTETLQGSFNRSEFNSIVGDGSSPEDDIGPIDLSGLGLAAEAALEEDLLWIASLLGAASVTPIAGAANLFRCTPIGAGAVSAFRPLAIEIERGDGRGVVTLGAHLSQLQIQAGEGPAQISYQVAGTRATEMGEATKEAGAAGTDPELRGIAASAYRTAADPVLWMKVIAVDPGVSVTLEFKIGQATAYSAAATTVVPVTTWITVLDHQAAPPDYVGVHPAGYRSPSGYNVEIYFADTDQVAVNDEWSVPLAGQRWVQALPAVGFVNSVYSAVEIDGVETPLSGYTLTIDRPVQSDEVTGGVFGAEPTEQGELVFTLSLSRTMIDTTFFDRIVSGAPFSFRSHLRAGSLIVAGNEATERRMSVIALNCKATAQTPSSVSNADRREEQIEARGYSSGDGTYPSPVTIDIVSSRASVV